MSERLRAIAREIFAEALAESTVAAAVARQVRVAGGHLLVAGRDYELARFSGVRIVSMGKAGATLFDAVRPLFPATLSVRAVISAPEKPRFAGREDRYFRGGHPLPNADSLAAATAAMQLLRGADEGTLALFLISGGASAMLEASLLPETTLAEMLELNRKLVGCGAPIAQINCVRKHVSAIKGGRLAVLAAPATCVSLLISDVPAGQLDALGSGPTLPDSTTVPECESVVDTYLGGAAGLPASYARLLAAGLPETPKLGDASFEAAHNVLLLDNTCLLDAAARAAHRRGFTVEIDNRCDDWDCASAADYLLSRVRSTPPAGGPLCLLSGGEITVTLPDRHGVGGRNQQWALHCAERLHATGESVTVLSAGSDGIDGGSPAAGSVADETTWTRAQDAGLTPQAHRAGFDAYPLFRALEDAVVTGATGNNLRDLRVLLRAGHDDKVG